MPNKDSAIGVFDSGVGGLTVVRRILEELPAESTLYFGDTARVPYGTKSAATVIRYAHACARFLVGRGIKLLVVACNTASAHALAALRADLDIPVIGVIEPGAAAAVKATRNGRIGVIGTTGTVVSGAYPAAIRALAPDTEVFCVPCPLFVPLAEEGWTDGPVPCEIARAYLRNLDTSGIDTLVLGCTHYPLLRSVIAEVAGPAVSLIDSAGATAAAVTDVLKSMGLFGGRTNAPEHRYFVSDAPDGFARIGGRFLGRDLGPIEWVDF